jgi:hypothetical protein
MGGIVTARDVGLAVTSDKSSRSVGVVLRDQDRVDAFEALPPAQL